MKLKYIDHSFNKSTTGLLRQITGIIDEYSSQHYKMTLRQLFYQLVSRDMIENTLYSYQKISRIVNKARQTGLIDWSIIIDSLRNVQLPYYYTDVSEAIKDTHDSYRLNRQAGQDVYVEVWTEKDAISRILYDITSEYHIPLVVNRGYSSITALHTAYKQRFTPAWQRGQAVVVLYLGDHDPSGLDMLRDIEDRIRLFAEVDFYNVSYNVVPVALTQQQINEYAPPPNYAKLTDKRGKEYVKQYGPYSYEVDALPPDVLKSIVTAAIEQYVDIDKVADILDQEAADKKELFKLYEKR